MNSGGDSPASPWYRRTVEEAVAHYESDARLGLSEQQAATRLESAGPNALAEHRGRGWAAMLLAQFRDFMILVLLAAALVSGVIGEAIDSIAILVILVLNAVIGAVQEFRAERAVAALRRMATPRARVRRDAQDRIVDARELVPGDLVLLESGNQVPADLRLVQAAELQVDESALTGESLTVDKSIDALGDDGLPLGDRCNMVYKGTLVTGGRAVGLTVATGMQTELGRIAGLLSAERKVRTPLQRRLTRFGRYLAVAVMVVCAVVFVTGLLQGQPLLLMALTAISLAVAAIPEALPAVVTVSLALGARKLSRRKSLVRNLPAVETLGSVTYICSDKTGTLTENRMHCERLLAGDENKATLPDSSAGDPWQALGQALALCNDVALSDGEPVGEPTERALFSAAAKAGYDKQTLEAQQPRIAEIPFDSGRKRMTTLHRDSEQVIAYVKGAPEVIVPRCDDRLTASGHAPLDDEASNRAALDLAAQGYRVLAIAQRRFDALPAALEEAEESMTLLGLVALMDPPREEAEAAVRECREAGIVPVMITGDHPGTAAAIARRVGIASEDSRVLSGEELGELSEEALLEAVAEVRVYARVNPEQKIRIVKALQARGEFVAMTGDGVNDAPALKRAGIGIAMGEKGTDVAREAADLVLLDDNFATIVSAVREGRRIFDNIRKFIKYTMTSNSGEIWTLFLAPFLGLPVPLLPIHILWINLVTDGLPGLALTAEAAEPGIMQRPPRRPDESIFAHGMWQHILWVGLLIGGLSIASQAWAYHRGSEYWQTVVFSVLTFAQLFQALAIRSDTRSLFGQGILDNRALLGAILFTVALQIAVIYVPVLQAVFKTQALPLADLAACFAIASLVLFAVEIDKWRQRRRSLAAR